MTIQLCQKSSIQNITIYVSMSYKSLLYFLFQLKRTQTNFILNFPMIMHLGVSTKLTLILLIQCRIWEVLKVLWRICKNIWPNIDIFLYCPYIKKIQVLYDLLKYFININLIPWLYILMMMFFFWAAQVLLVYSISLKNALGVVKLFYVTT